MAKKHFSLPDNILEWIKKEANQNGMRESHFLAHILMNMMQSESTTTK